MHAWGRPWLSLIFLFGLLFGHATGFGQVSAPVFSPSSQASSFSLPVTVTCATPGVTIRYTTNGQSPTTADAPIANGGTLSVSRSLTLKARAWNVSGQVSAETAADYDIIGMVSAGITHIGALRFDGLALAWGDQFQGALSNSGTAAVIVMSPVLMDPSGSGTSIPQARHISAGSNHTLIVTGSGTVLASGANASGQLGDNTTTIRANAVQVVGSGGSGVLANISQVAAGGDYSLALEATGSKRVYSWGSGVWGRLGHNATSARSAPGFVLKAASGSPELTGIEEISAGLYHGLARDTSGNVWSWGLNSSGQLGQGDTANKTRADRVLRWESYLQQPVLDGIRAISAGEDHSVAIRNTGTFNHAVYAWGQQQYGTTGNGQTASDSKRYAFRVEKLSGGFLDNINKIDAGGHISLALDFSGTVWAWGRNNTGAVGDGNTTNVSQAVPIAVTGTAANAPKVVAISAGGTGSGYCLALDEDGKLYAWGNNISLMLGTGAATIVSIPTASGTNALGNQPPSGSLTLTGGPFVAPATVTLNVNATDNDDGVTDVRFFQNNALLATDSSAPYTHTITNLVSGSYNFTATITETSGAVIPTNSVPLNIPLPSITLSRNPATLAEAGGLNGTFSITRNETHNQPLTVPYALTGTAFNGLDYATVTPQTATISAGATGATVTITPTPDTIYEAAENVTLSLTPAPTLYNIITGTATITITDPPPGWIAKISGDTQSAPPTDWLPLPFVTEVRQASGTPPLSQAPVTYTITSGGGGLAAISGAPATANTIVIPTGINGQAGAYYQLGPDPAVTSTITAFSGTSPLVTFTAQTVAGLWTHWPLNDGTGTTTDEITTFGADGSLVGGPTWTAGMDGRGALAFTGTAHVTMGAPTPPTRPLDLSAGSFTILTWVKYTSIPAPGTIRRFLGKGMDTSNPGYFLGLHGDGKIAFGLGATTNTAADTIVAKTTSPFADDQWHHVAVVMDRTAQTVQIFIDGTAWPLEKFPGTGGSVSASSLSLAGLTSLTATSGAGAPFTLASLNGTDQFFTGEIDDTQIHRKALSATEVADLHDFSGDNDGPGTPLPDWWEFRNFGNLNGLSVGNSDGDSLTNSQEYQGGTDPNDYFNGLLPEMQKLSGDAQIGEPSATLPQPLVVKLTNIGGAALPSAPVTFSITGTHGLIALSGTGPFASTQSFTTAGDGTASIFLRLGAQMGVTHSVVAQAVSGTSSVSTTFTATSDSTAHTNLVSGNGQIGLPDEYLSAPLVVEVLSGTAGPALAGRIVTFTVASGSGGLAATSGSASTTGSLVVTTGSDGRAFAWLKQGSAPAAANTVTAITGTTAAVTFSSTTTLADGLWARWKFDETTGTVAAEATGLAVSGTLAGGATWTTGTTSPQAVLFSGSNPYVTMGHPADSALDFGKGNFTLALWVNYTGAPAEPETRRLVSKGHTGWGAGYILALRGDGKLTAGLGSTTSQQADSLLFETTEEFNDGAWHHVAVVFDQIGGEARIYVDGTARSLTKEVGTGGTITSGTPITFSGMSALSATAATPFTISSLNGASEFFAGEVYDVRIYRRALDASDVQAVYNFSGDGDTLPDWWERKYLNTLAQGNGGNDDGDLRDNLAEYLNGSDPTDYYNGTLPILEKLSGDGQTGEVLSVLPNPLTVQVTTSGTAQDNAPVAFSISGSLGQIATSGTGPFGPTAEVRTGTAGTAAVYLQLSGSAGAAHQVQALATSGTTSTAVTFSATTELAASGTLTIISGNTQTGRANEYLGSPFTVEVRSGTAGTLQIGAPVTYTVTSGTGGLATQFGGTTYSGTLPLVTGSNGRAQAWFRLAADATNTISVTSGTSEVVFTATRAGGEVWSAWSFDEGYGNTAQETTGLGADGTLTNYPLWSEGFDGMGGVEFSGSNSYVTMGQPAGRSLDLGGDSFTVAFWVRYTEVPGSSETFRIVSKGFDNFGPGYFVGLRGDGKLAAGLGTTSGTAANAILFKTTGTFNDGQWHAVAAVYDRANGLAQIYVDGTARSLEKEVGTGGTVTSGTLSLAGLSTLSASGTASPFTISSFSGTSQFFQGEVDQVEIHKSVLGAPAIEAIYNADLDGNELPDWWEYKHFQYVGIDPDDDDDRDGLTNAEEYEQASDPTDYYDQGETTIIPVITLISGNGQTSGTDEFLTNPFTVEVHSGTTALVNAPVIFTVTSGSGVVADQPGGASGITNTVYTDSNGQAVAWYRQGNEVNVTSTITAQAGASNTLTFEASTSVINSLVGHWKFDEGTGTTASDSAPFLYTGTLVDGPTWQERFAGENSLHFSGSGAHVLTTSGTSGMLDFADADFSVTAWVKIGTTAPSGRIISKGNENANPGYFLAVNEQGQIETGLGTTQSGTSSETIRIKTNESFNDDAWHAVAAVYDRGTSTAKIYIDGTIRTISQDVGSGGAINPGDSTQLDYPGLENLSGSQSAVPLTIASQSGTSAFFMGGLDEVRIYRKALTAEEALALYQEDGELVALEDDLVLAEDTLGTIALRSHGGGDATPVYEIVTQPASGEVALSGATASYAPNAHFYGSDEFRFRVTKGAYSAEATIYVYVEAGDDPPLVNVAGGRSVTLPNAVSLSATVTDIDTDASYILLNWRQVSGAGTVEFTGVNSLSATATFSEPGEYVLQLSANDGTTVRSDSLVVIVNPAGSAGLPTVSVEEPENNTAYTFSQAIPLRAVASAGGGKTVAKVEFYEGSRKIGEDTVPDSVTGRYELQWTPDHLGAYNISAKVTDNVGQGVFSDGLEVRVTEGGWFTDEGVGAGNEGYSGSGGPGGIPEGTGTGSGSYVDTGLNGGGQSANGGGNGYGGPAGSGSETDSDGDGLSDVLERDKLGTRWEDPNNDKDSDGDGLEDGADAVPTNKVMKVLAAPEVQYAIIDLGTEYAAAGINDAGAVLLIKSGSTPNLQVGALWSSGTTQVIGEGHAGSFRGPILKSGTTGVYFGTPAQVTGTTGNSVSVSSNQYWVSGSVSNQGVYAETQNLSTALGVPLPGSPPSTGVLGAKAKAFENSAWASMKGSFDPQLVGWSPNPDGGHQQTLTASLHWANDIGDQSFSASTDASQALVRPGYYPNGMAVAMIVSGHQSLPDTSSSVAGYIRWGGDFPELPNFAKINDYRVNTNRQNIASVADRPAVVVASGTAHKYLPEALSVADISNLATTEGPYYVGTSSTAETTLWCYNSGTFARQPIGGSAPGGAGASKVASRMISNRLVIPQGTGIWRNGRFIDVRELCGGAAQDYTEWNIFQVSPEKNFLVATATKNSIQHAVLLLPIEMKLLWETENKANQVYNPTQKDDPWGGGGYGGYGTEQNGAPRNKLFLVPDPEDNKYKATLEVEMPEQFRTKFYAAAYVGETKVANSDTVFNAEGQCELEFEHLGTSNDIEDFAIRIGYDANNSSTLDPDEITKLDVKNLGEPIVRGTKVSKYDDAKDKIDNIIDGDWTTPGWATDLVLPHAKQFLRIFRQGDTAGVPSDKLPTSSVTVSFDAFNGYFAEWLTHNSGAPFSDEGVASITDYTWGPLTSTANMVATSPQIEEPVRNYYNSSVAGLAAAHFASLPVGSPPAYFPSETGLYDIPHTHESPAWVPVTTITFDSWLPNQGDDVNGTIGRGRLLNHKARYRVEKLLVNEGPPDAPYYVERLVVTQVISQGVAIDLYDFNHMVGGAAQDAAILQIGFGKGAYGGARDRGKIYRNRIEFNKTHASLP